MKNREFPVFGEEVELPETVRAKMEEAFCQVRRDSKVIRFPGEESNGAQAEQKKKETGVPQVKRKEEEVSGLRAELKEEKPGDRRESQRRRTGGRPGRLKRTAIVAICAALLTAGLITAAAAVYTRWSRGMRDALQASPGQQQELVERGVAVILREETAAGEGRTNIGEGRINLGDDGTNTGAGGTGTANAGKDGIGTGNGIAGTGADGWMADETGNGTENGMLPASGAGVGDGASGSDATGLGKGNEASRRGFMPVTDNGVTVRPNMVVTTSDCVWLSFFVEGFDLPEGAEPIFGGTDVYFGDGRDDKVRWLNMGGSFSDGIVSDGYGHAVYGDGTASDEPIQPRYVNEDGSMEYVIHLAGEYEGMSYLGQSLHVRFRDLGTVAKAEFTKILEGTWEFTIPLSDVDSYRSFTAAAPIGDTGIRVKKLEISPVSIRGTLSVPEQGTVDREAVVDMTFPCGLRFKDGTMLPCISNGGSQRFMDESYTEFCFNYPWDRVIDLDQVDALVFFNPHEIGKENSQNRYIIIPLFVKVCSY